MPVGKITNEDDLRRFVDSALGAALERAKKSISIGLEDLTSAVLNRFLKLLVPGDHKIAWGTDSINGGGSILAVKTINHGLGGVPAIVLISAANESKNAAYGLPNDTSFLAQLRDVDSNVWSTTESFSWLAIR